MRIKVIVMLLLLLVGLAAVARMVTGIMPEDRSYKFEARDGEFFINQREGP